MTKNKFLKELESKLNILEENELKDTLNEYRNIIEEKVASGKTEKEAVADFGDIDELADEILKAYKINTKKLNSDNYTTDDFEQSIKNIAGKMADATRNIFKEGTELSIESIFEIIIKFILLLIGFAVLRLPFDMIKGLGTSILDFNLYPVDQILSIIWSLLVVVAYFITCAIIFIVTFKNYFKIEEQKEEKPKKKISKPQEKSEVLKTTSLIGKAFIIICFIIPLFFVQLGLGIAIAVLAYLAFTGLPFIGPIITLIGLGICFEWANDLLMQIIKGFKSFKTYKITAGMVVMSFGLILSTNDILRINYINETPNIKFETKTITKNINIDKPLDIGYFEKSLLVEDENMEDGEVHLEIAYKKEFLTISNVRVIEDEDELRLTYKTINNNSIEAVKKIKNQVIKDLKNNKVYDYSNLLIKEIKITANSKTLKLIEE